MTDERMIFDFHICKTFADYNAILPDITCDHLAPGPLTTLYRPGMGTSSAGITGHIRMTQPSGHTLLRVSQPENKIFYHFNVK